MQSGQTLQLRVLRTTNGIEAEFVEIVEDAPGTQLRWELGLSILQTPAGRPVTICSNNLPEVPCRTSAERSSSPAQTLVETAEVIRREEVHTE